MGLIVIYNDKVKCFQSLYNCDTTPFMKMNVLCTFE